MPWGTRFFACRGVALTGQLVRVRCRVGVSWHESAFPFGRSGRNRFNMRRLRRGIVGLMVICIELMKLARMHTGMRGH